MSLCRTCKQPVVFARTTDSSKSVPFERVKNLVVIDDLSDEDRFLLMASDPTDPIYQRHVCKDVAVAAEVQR